MFGISLLIITTFTSSSLDAFLRLLRISLRKTKLKAFDYPFVKNSKNRDLKAKLRKAETYLDIITIVCEFRKENYV